MKALIYSTRPYSGKFVTSLLQQFKLVETICSDIDILFSTKTDSNLNYIETVSKLSLNPVNYFYEFYTNEVVHMKNWEEAYDKLDVSCLEKYDHIFVFGGILSDSSGLKRGSKRTGFPVNDRGQINFLSVGSPLLHVLACLKANHVYGTKLHEIMYDQQEVSINTFHPDYIPKENYRLYHGYTSDHYKCHRLDSLQYFLEEDFIFGLTSSSKIYEFTFGYTCITKDRLWVKEDVDSIIKNFDKINLFVHDKINDNSNFIDRDKYLELIAESKYTLIIPAYDVHAVSIYRIIESVNLGCIPLFHKNVNISELESDFGKLPDGIILKDNSFEPFTEEVRCDIIKRLREMFVPYRKGFRL